MGTRPPPRFIPVLILGAYRAQKIKKNRSGNKGFHVSALDFNAPGHNNRCLYKCSHGGSDCLASDSIQRLAGGNSMGSAFWRVDLGDLFWQLIDYAIPAQVTEPADER